MMIVYIESSRAGRVCVEPCVPRARGQGIRKADYDLGGK